MDMSRRDFMKMMGISVSSLLLARCRSFPTTASATPIPATSYPFTCYATVAPVVEPSPTPDNSARVRLRQYWQSFGDVMQVTIHEFNQANQMAVPTVQAEPTSTPKPPTLITFGGYLIAKHRLALDELVSSEELTPEVADLIQEAYAAAVYHVWRSNAPITCYAPAIVDYTPASASILVKQADALSAIAMESNIDPATLEKAQTAIEHDLAFYALTDEEVKTLYEQLASKWKDQPQGIPSFENIDLEVTPDVKAATEFIIDLLTKK